MNCVWICVDLQYSRRSVSSATKTERLEDGGGKSVVFEVSVSRNMLGDAT